MSQWAYMQRYVFLYLYPIKWFTFREFKPLPQLLTLGYFGPLPWNKHAQTCLVHSQHFLYQAADITVADSMLHFVTRWPQTKVKPCHRSHPPAPRASKAPLPLLASALFHERFTEVRPTKKVQTPGHCRQQRLAILSSLKVRISLSISFSRFVYVRMHFRTGNMVQLPDTQDRKSFIIHNYSYHANLSKPNPSCVLCLCAPCILISVVFVLKWISLLRKCNLRQFTSIYVVWPCMTLSGWMEQASGMSCAEHSKPRLDHGTWQINSHWSY